MNKSVLALLFVTLMFAPLFFNGIQLNATTQLEPQLTIAGNVTKDVVNFNNLFNYIDKNGDNRTLPYVVGGNITFNVLNIELADQFINASTAGVKTSSTELTIDTVDLLKDANGIAYLLLKADDNAALTGNTWYYAALEDTVDVEVDSSTYLLFMGDAEMLTGTADAYVIKAIFKCLDEYANIYYIEIGLQASPARTYVSTSNTIIMMLASGTTNVVQVNVYELVESIGVSARLNKITAVKYYIAFKTPDTPAADNVIAGKFYAAIATDKKWYINNFLVNNTVTVNVPAAEGIFSSLPLNKIADATIPFIWVPEPEKAYNADELSVKYDWVISVPDDPALSFSNVNANITMTENYEEIKYLYINGNDYTTNLETNKYYSFAMVAGTNYVISLKVIYDEDTYDAIIGIDEAPGFWASPIDYIKYWFWHIVFFFASLLGLTSVAKSAKAGKRKAKSRTL